MDLSHHGGDAYQGSGAQVEIIDLPSIADRSVQILTASTVLEMEWGRARQAWGEALNKPPEEDQRVPTLVVVDEAHNLLSNEPRNNAEAALREQFRRIAAEGRKFDVFLVVVSQRPDKLDRLVLSECDNKVIMKLGSQSVLNVTRELLGLDDLPEKILGKCLEFDQGRGLLLGDWVSGSPTLFYSAARRTIEGGRNLRPGAWALSPPTTDKSEKRAEKIDKQDVVPIPSDFPDQITG